MIPLFRKLVYALLYDEMKVRRWSRAFFLGGAVAIVQWQAPEAWATAKAAAAIVFGSIAAMINLGQPNPKTPAPPDGTAL